MKCQISYQFNLDEPGEQECMSSLLAYQKTEDKLNAFYELIRQIIKYDYFPDEFQECSEEEKRVLARFAERIRTLIAEHGEE